MIRERQWQAALRRGNAIRLARSSVRRALKAGEMDIRDALEHPSVQTMPVIELLAFLPARRGGGRAKQPRPAKALAQQIARAAWIRSETVPVSALSPARRDHLARVARRAAPGYRVAGWPSGRRDPESESER